MLVSKNPFDSAVVFGGSSVPHAPGSAVRRVSASFVTFSYAAGLSYLKQTDGNFDYLDPARFLPSSLQGCADHACDAGR